MIEDSEVEAFLPQKTFFSKTGADVNKTQTIHKESPLKIPLVNIAINDPHIKISQRGVDTHWFHHEIISHNVVGFNPSELKIYVGKESPLARWLKKPNQSFRPFNNQDFAMRELLFCVHDYLHCWAYQAVNEVFPKLGFGFKEITQKNFEDFVFCHILTEAVAVVGLDYWYLSTIKLNDVVDIGTFQGPLSNKYHEEDLPEFRKWNKNINVQDRNFFRSIVEFYCDGGFPGFDQRDAQLSPLVSRWVRKELTYSDLQRSYTRRWLSHLSGDTVKIHGKDLNNYIETKSKWRIELMNEVGKMLWLLVKENRPTSFSHDFIKQSKWQTKKTNDLLFQFSNLHLSPCADDLEETLQNLSPTSFKFFAYQYISTHKLEESRLSEFESLESLVESRNFREIQRLLAGSKKLKMEPNEPAHLFMFN